MSLNLLLRPSGGRLPAPTALPVRLEWLALALAGGAQVLVLLCMLRVWDGWLPLPLSQMGWVLLLALVPAALPLLFWVRLSRGGRQLGGLAPAAARLLHPLAPLLGSMVVVCYWWGHCMLAAIGLNAAHDALRTLFAVATAGSAFTAVANAAAGQHLTTALVSDGPVPAVLNTLVLLLVLPAAVPRLQPLRSTLTVAAAASLLGAAGWLLVRGGGMPGLMSAWQPGPLLSDPFMQAGAVSAALFMVGPSLSAYEGLLALTGPGRGRRGQPRPVALVVAGLAGTALVTVLTASFCLNAQPVPAISAISAIAGNAAPASALPGSTAGAVAALGVGLLDAVAPGWLLLGAGLLALQLSQRAGAAALAGLGRRRPSQRPPAHWLARLATAATIVLFCALREFPWMYAGAALAYFVGLAGAAAVVLAPRLIQPSAVQLPCLQPPALRWVGHAALVAALVWLGAAVLGLQAWGIQAVLIGLVMIYAGGLLHLGSRMLYPGRRPEQGARHASIHAKLLAGMLLILALNGVGYLIATQALNGEERALGALVGDIFTAVALLTVLVGLILPALIVHALTRAAEAAEHLAHGAVTQLRKAIDALGRGELDHMPPQVQLRALETPFRDEIGRIASSINLLQADVHHAANSLQAARESLRRSRAELFRQARHDSLTGLHNRRAFEEELARVASDRRNPSPGHALLYLDLDQFKIVNDTCGHDAGDELLRQISLLLSGQTRSADILSRLGGDEFGVILENCSREDAVRIAESMLTAVRELSFGWHERVFRVGVSIGVVHFISGTMTLTDVMSAADKACYYAKEQGRNRLHAYSPDDDEIRTRSGEMQWVSRIHEAMEQGRLCLYAQRIQALRADSLHGCHYEVLLRMVDPAGELVPPMAFIPAAERYGVMPLIDRWVVRTALQRLAGLAPAAEGEPMLSLAVNLSGASITDESFLEYVKEQFRLWQVPHQSIWFEITETSAIANLKKAKRFIAELRSLGCRFGLDDFGAGMSSFGYLRQLEVDFLKIDGLFVRDMVEDQVDCAMVESINRIGQLMGLETIAEFVEDRRCMAMLDAMGVNMVQGNGVDAPVPFIMPGHEVIFPPRAQARVALAG